MAIIPLPLMQGRLPGLRAKDRFDLPAASDARANRMAGILVGTAIVAGCVAGLFLYDAGRPFATGALTQPPPLVIMVEPMPAGQAQPR